jgi:two-component system alkaline phosphatase synthesis response regulator PhoP
MPKPRVLIVEDDPAIRSGVAGALAADGYETVEAEDGERGLVLAGDDSVALVLLDIMLPRVDGLHVLESIRERRPRLPVICLTALGEEADRVRGLRAGADDYIVKPFGLDELLARVEAVLRRSAGGPSMNGNETETPDGVFEIAGCRIDLARQEVTPPGGAARVLPQREAEVLGYLAENRGRAVTREELLERVWGIDPRGMQTRSVDMAVARLREQLADSGPDHGVIITVRGRGYMLAGEA